MPRKEITTIVKQEFGLTVQTIGSDTTTTGSAIDTADYNGGVNVIFFLGTRTDGTFTPSITESDTIGGSYTLVANENLVSQSPLNTAVAPLDQAVLDTSDSTSKVGYVGTKRFIKVAFVSTSVTTGSVAGILVTKLGDVAPVSA